MEKKEAGSVILPIILVVFVLLVLGAVYYFLNHKSSVAVKTTIVPTNNPVPTSPVTDYAPGLPASQKATIVVRNTDSSTQTFLVPKTEENSFISHLPKGEVVVSK